MLRLVGLLSALALQTAAMAAEPSVPGDRVGDAYEIRIRSETETSSDIASGSSTSGGVLIERVVAIDTEGLHLEFDLPDSTPEEQRKPEWQLPVRVLRSNDGTLKLLNEPELRARNQRWLKLAKLKPESCGLWYFTWTAFKIECDPQSALAIVAPNDLRFGPLVDGGAHREEGGLGLALLRLERTGAGGATFVTEVQVDPETVRRQRAEQDVALAQMLGEPTKNRDSFLRARVAKRVSGKIVARFETDPSGRVIRRVRVITLEIVTPSGSETSTTTETTVRRLISRGP